MSCNNENKNNVDIQQMNLLNIENLSDIDLMRLFVGQDTSETSRTTTLPFISAPPTSAVETNSINSEQFMMVKHLSLARKHGFFIGINVLTANRDTLQTIQCAWNDCEIPYHVFSFLYEEYEMDANQVKNLSYVFNGTPEQIAHRVAFEWIPDILQYIAVNDDMLDSDYLSEEAVRRILDISVYYNAELLKDIIYTLILAIDFDITIHDLDGKETNAFTLKFLMDMLVNPYALIANLEQIVASDIVELVDIATPLLERIPNTDTDYNYDEDDVYPTNIECLLNIFVTIQAYYMHILFEKAGENKYEEFISAVSSNEITLILVNKELSMFIEAFIKDIHEQVPFVPNVLVQMMDSDSLHE